MITVTSLVLSLSYTICHNYDPETCIVLNCSTLYYKGGDSELYNYTEPKFALITVS